MQQQPTASLVDAMGRPLRDLRLSVTDRCNFRCRYCMPRETVSGAGFLKKSELLSYEELTTVARAFVRLGVRKLRITGGEPLLRRDLPLFIEQLAPLTSDLALTTNGVLLPQLAAPLRAAGLNRLTISLDALDEAVFQRMADAPQFSARATLAGIDAAARAGFETLKVNAVIRRGVNESELLPLVRHFSGSGVVLRFIEYMAVGTRNGWNQDEVVSASAIREELARHFEVQELPRNGADATSSRLYLPSQKLEVGIIASVTESFCGQCTRARVSSDGQLFDCLFAEQGLNLKALLRAHQPARIDWALTEAIQQFWQKRRARFSEALAEEESRAEQLIPAQHLSRRIEMSYIGG